MSRTSTNPASTMRGPSSTKGIALVAALALMAVASGVMLLLFMRTMDELRHGRDDAAIIQTLLVAHGGANLGISVLHGDVRVALDEIASTESDSSGSWSFGSSGPNDLMPSASSVATDMQAIAVALQPEIDDLLCGDHTLADGNVLTLRIHVTDTACGQALPDDTRLGDGHFVSGSRRELGGANGGNQTYALPFVMVADGQIGEFRRRVVTQGEYQFVAGRRSFARYALFTDVHSSAGSGGRIWFTGDTLFDGPVHTNGNFNFYDRPWFGGAVSSAGVNNAGQQGAYAYDGGNGDFRSARNLENGGNNPNMDEGRFTNRPQFSGGVDWRSDYIDLPKNAHDQRNLADQDGILITENISILEMYAGYEDGDRLRYNDNEPADYQFVRAYMDRSPGGWGWVTWRISPDGRLERLNEGGMSTWQLVTDDFNGVIYAEDYIERLRGPGRNSNNNPATAGPAIAHFSQITLVPEEGARITEDLIYEDQPCEGYLHRDDGDVVRAECENLDAINVFGIFSPRGDILIGNDNSNGDDNAPADVRIQASLMTSQGIVAVEDFDEGSPRGSVRLLGGIIEEEYGAFGTFNGNTGNQSSGYSRQFTFDPRLARGLTPPYFPTVGQEGVTDVQTFTFGHREQVY